MQFLTWMAPLDMLDGDGKRPFDGPIVLLIVDAYL